MVVPQLTERTQRSAYALQNSLLGTDVFLNLNVNLTATLA